MDYDKAVRRGMRMLDRRSPGWDGKIDAGRLNIASCRDCVIGQLQGEYTHDGVSRLVGLWTAVVSYLFFGSPGERYGFWSSNVYDYRNLTQAWKRAIKLRRRTVKIQARRDKRGHRRPEHVLANAV